MFFCHLFFTIGTMRMNLNSCVSFFIRHTLVDKQLFLQLTFILYFTLKKTVELTKLKKVFQLNGNTRYNHHSQKITCNV